MLERNEDKRGEIRFVDLESMVPAEHLLRKIDKVVDFGSYQTTVVADINESELQDINHESNNSVMHQNILGIANSFATKSLNASTQSKIFTFN